MKHLAQIIAVLTFVFSSSTNLHAQIIKVAQFEAKVNFKPSLTKSFGNHLDIENRQSADLLPPNLTMPAQVVFAHVRDTDQQVSMVVLGNKSKQSLSPAWFYVMMLIVLLVALFWNDEPHHLRNKD